MAPGGPPHPLEANPAATEANPAATGSALQHRFDGGPSSAAILLYDLWPPSALAAQLFGPRRDLRALLGMAQAALGPRAGRALAITSGLELGDEPPPADFGGPSRKDPRPSSKTHTRPTGSLQKAARTCAGAGHRRYFLAPLSDTGRGLKPL
jgi:hypothetical protein